MAVDGSIRLDVSIKTDAAEAGMDDLIREAEKTADALENAGERMTSAFGFDKALENAKNKAAAVEREYEALYQKIREKEAGIRADRSEFYRGDETGLNKAVDAALDKDAEYNKWLGRLQKLESASASARDAVATAEQAATIRAEKAVVRAEERKRRETEKTAAAQKKAAEKAAAAQKNSIDSVIKRIGKMALSVLSIRGAYSLLSRAAQNAMSRNDELRGQMEAVWNVLGTAVAPVVQEMVRWITVAISYVNALIQSLTGVDLIAKANAQSLKRQAAATKEAAKAARQAGFDEINKLSGSDSGAASGSAGTTDASAGIFKPVEVDTAAVEEIKRLIEDLLPVVGAVGAAFLTWKVVNGLGLPLGDCAGWVAIIAGAALAVAEYLGMWENGIDWDNLIACIAGVTVAATALFFIVGQTAAVIFLLVGGVALVVLGFKDWLENGKSLQALAAITAGVIALGVAFALVVGWPALLVAAIVAIVVAVVMYWDEIKAVLAKGWKWFDEHIIRPIGQFFVNLWNDTVNLAKKVGNFFKKMGQSIVNFVSGAFKGAINGVLTWLEWALNNWVKLLNGAIKLIDKIPGVNIPEIQPVKLPRLARGGIVNNPGYGVPLVAGEAGREAVLPLDRNTEWMDMLADRLGSAGGEKSIVVNVVLNGRTIQREVRRMDGLRTFATNGGIG